MSFEMILLEEKVFHIIIESVEFWLKRLTNVVYHRQIDMLKPEFEKIIKMLFLIFDTKQSYPFYT